MIYNPASTNVPSQKSRLTIVGSVYHQIQGDQPTSIQIGSSKTLSSEDLPDRRKITLGPEWQELDASRLIGKVSYLTLENQEGRGLQTIPTEEEAKDIASRVIEIGSIVILAEERSRTMHSPPKERAIPVATWLVPPGDTYQGIPADIKTLRLRCRNGSARCLLTLFPQ